MSRQRIKLTQAQLNELQAAQLSSSDAALAMRYQAVRLYGSGYAVSEIQAICGCSLASLWEWSRKYQQTGVAGLVDQRQGGNHTLLSPLAVEEVQGLLHRYQPQQLLPPGEYQGSGEFWSLADLAHLIAKRYGVRYQSATSYRNLFAKCDFSYQRATQQYHSRSDTKVMAFEEALEKNC
jgi:transposase